MKFVIACSSRTGSTMLNSAFNNHPDISGFDEAMTARNVKAHNLVHPDSYIQWQRSWRYVHSLWFWYRYVYIKNKFSSNTPQDTTELITKEVLSDWLDWLYKQAESVVFKLLYPHVEVLPDIVDLIHEKDIKVIILVRDPAERIASMRAKFGLTDPQEILIKQTLFELEQLKKWFPEHLEISYEEITNNKEVREFPEEVTKKIFDYLELPFTVLKAVSNKVRK